MRTAEELKQLHEKWSGEMLSKLNGVPDTTERLRLSIEAEKVSLLSEIAQGVAIIANRS